MTDTHGAAQSGQLSISDTTVGDIRVVTLRGEIDHTVKDELIKALLSAESASPRTVVDLSAVTFMDSSGINVFVIVHQKVSEAGGWLRFAGAQEAVLRVLQLVGLDKVIPSHPTVEQALAV
ncbi:STAS domain-containing protein [Streptomyces sp. BV286]|uniref:STAS domain-containing protein n=1 Tax=unclassified Streptomyces TaxID=2593676 RepID=UPI0027E51CF7|nr:STAS domain-containing protein [Streptomyces sp. BV286]